MQFILDVVVLLCAPNSHLHFLTDMFNYLVSLMDVNSGQTTQFKEWQAI